VNGIFFVVFIYFIKQNNMVEEQYSILRVMDFVSIAMKARELQLEIEKEMSQQ
jgi:hypothetical protein